MTCKNCSKTIPADWNFCLYCGHKVEQPTLDAPAPSPACRSCGAALRGSEAFCGQCGAPVQPAEAAPQASRPAASPSLKPATGKKGVKPIAWVLGGVGFLVVAAALIAAVIFVVLPAMGMPADTLLSRITGQMPADRDEDDGKDAEKTAKPKPTAATAAPTAAAATVAPSEKPAPTAPPIDPATLSPVQLRWTLVGGGYSDSDMSVVMSQFNDSLKTMLNTTIELKLIGWGDFQEQYNVMLAAGDAGDMMFTGYWFSNYRTAIQAGSYTELSSYVDQYGWNIKKALGEGMMRAATVNSKLYGIPVSDQNYHSYGIMVQKGMAEKYGLNIDGVRSVQDLEAAFEQVLSHESGVIPLYVTSSYNPVQFLDWVSLTLNASIPGALPAQNQTGSKIVNQYSAPETEELYRLMRRYYEKGYINPDSTDGNTSGKFFAYYTPLNPDSAYEASMNSGIEWQQIQLTAPAISAADAQECMTVIPNSSQNKDRAMMFLDLLYGEADLMNLLGYGIEGTHYVMLSDGTIKAGASSGNYSPGNYWMFGNNGLLFTNETTKAGKWERMAQQARSAFAPRSLGFFFESANVSAEVTACQDVIDRYYQDLCLGKGTSDVETMISSFETGLSAAGADAIIAEMQRQYDAWLAAQ